jgi:hypothetical protein
MADDVWADFFARRENGAQKPPQEPWTIPRGFFSEETKKVLEAAVEEAMYPSMQPCPLPRKPIRWDDELHFDWSAWDMGEEIDTSHYE